jgi:aerobic-type carbon monoxide dehydrogenase small subunit (CoxS/CutS family)
MVMVELATSFPSSVTDAGANAHVVFVGNVPHAKFNVKVAPLIGVTFSMSVPDCPALTVNVEGETATVKSGATLTVCVSGDDVLTAKFASPP